MGRYATWSFGSSIGKGRYMVDARDGRSRVDRDLERMRYSMLVFVLVKFL